MGEKPVVYLASPYRGAIKQNEAFARLAMTYAIRSGAVPVAPHLFYPQVLNEHKMEDRALGMKLGLELLKRCDELWLCGDEQSSGMTLEEKTARKAGIVIRRIPAAEIYAVLLQDGMRQTEMGARDVFEQSL